MSLLDRRIFELEDQLAVLKKRRLIEQAVMQALNEMTFVKHHDRIPHWPGLCAIQNKIMDSLEKEGLV
jgi:hypothetical protein